MPAIEQKWWMPAKWPTKGIKQWVPGAGHIPPPLPRGIPHCHRNHTAGCPIAAFRISPLRIWEANSQWVQQLPRRLSDCNRGPNRPPQYSWNEHLHLKDTKVLEHSIFQMIQQVHVCLVWQLWFQHREVNNAPDAPSPLWGFLSSYCRWCSGQPPRAANNPEWYQARCKSLEGVCLKDMYKDHPSPKQSLLCTEYIAGSNESHSPPWQFQHSYIPRSHRMGSFHISASQDLEMANPAGMLHTPVVVHKLFHKECDFQSCPSWNIRSSPKMGRC